MFWKCGYRSPCSKGSLKQISSSCFPAKHLQALKSWSIIFEELLGAGFSVKFKMYHELGPLAQPHGSPKLGCLVGRVADKYLTCLVVRFFGPLLTTDYASARQVPDAHAGSEPSDCMTLGLHADTLRSQDMPRLAIWATRPGEFVPGFGPMAMKQDPAQCLRIRTAVQALPFVNHFQLSFMKHQVCHRTTLPPRAQTPITWHPQSTSPPLHVTKHPAEPLHKRCRDPRSRSPVQVIGSNHTLEDASWIERLLTIAATPNNGNLKAQLLGATSLGSEPVSTGAHEIVRLPGALPPESPEPGNQSCFWRVGVHIESRCQP